MSWLNAVAVSLAPWLFFLLPGVAVIHYFQGTWPEKIARVFLCSIATLTLLLLLATFLGLPNYIVLAVVCTITFVWLVKNRRLARGIHIWIIGLHGVVALLLTLSLALPFYIFQDGLPTGDSQKAIYWAQQINDTHTFPPYQQAVQMLNRDPVDFYTPGLHALTAAVMRLSPYPLITVGYFSLLVVVASFYVGAAFIRQLFPARDHLALTAWYVLALLGNIRFLRYIREPGYHYQNLLGEFLLFGLLLLALSLLQRWRWPDAILACVVGAALLVTHQFSMFLAFFLMLPYLIAFFAQRMRQRIVPSTALMKKLFTGITAVLVGGVCTFTYATGLLSKLPHLFTWQAHLISLVPSLSDYGTLLGPLWVCLGLGGVFLLIKDWRFFPTRLGLMPFLISTCIILLFSQAPRFGIDIPPVRALFYSALPLAIISSYFCMRIWRLTLAAPWHPYLTRSLILLIVLGTVSSTFIRAIRPTHAVRTNSTLLPEYTVLEEYLAPTMNGAILVDDYNRRSTSWLLLTGHPTYSRLAADVSRQMDEAQQSVLREELYLRQLDYEKIFSLGSLPVSSSLLHKHNIKWLTGIAASSTTGFAHNPLLKPRAQARDVILYEVEPSPMLSPLFTPELEAWLLRGSTLVNDIGDLEDTYAHLPASVRSARVSEPVTAEGSTWRTTTSPLIPLHFNSSDYVRALWSKNHQQRPDIALEFFLTGRDLPSDLSVSTPSGKLIPLHGGNQLIRLEPSDVPYDDAGNITLTLTNPSEKSVALDVIALGLAHVP